jgi:hypothetical protein
MALDPGLQASFDSLATLATSRALGDLPRKWQGVDRDAAARGMLSSGSRLVQVEQAAISVLHACAAELLSALEDVLRVLRGNAAALPIDDVVEMLSSRFHEFARSVKATLNSKLEQSGRGLRMNWRANTTEFDGATQQVGQELVARARLAVMAAAAASEGQRLVQHQTFHGPVGAVQTGHGAVANVVQQVSMPEIGVLLQSLHEVRDAVTAAASISEAKRAEALEVLQELEAQANRAKPNALSVSGLLSGLGGVAEGLANAPQAWATLCAWGTALANAV